MDTMEYYHKNLANGGWQKYSLAEQLANIGSEVSRAIVLKEKGDSKNMEKSLYRALELIDLTISDSRWRGRTSEIFRLREVLCDFFVGSNIYNTEPGYLEKYFLSFALMVARQKERAEK